MNLSDATSVSAPRKSSFTQNCEFEDELMDGRLKASSGGILGKLDTSLCYSTNATIGKLTHEKRALRIKKYKMW